MQLSRPIYCNLRFVAIYPLRPKIGPPEAPEVEVSKEANGRSVVELSDAKSSFVR